MLSRCPILVFPAAIVVTVAGCSTLAGHTTGAVDAAARTDSEYAALEASLSNCIVWLEGLAETPGDPESFLKNLVESERAVADTAYELRKSREALLEHGREYVRLLNEEAAKFADADLRGRFTAEAERVRVQYERYDADTAAVATSFELGHNYVADIRRALEIDRSQNGPVLVQGTLRKAVDEFKVTRQKIPAARRALAELRKQQPKPVAK